MNLADMPKITVRFAPPFAEPNIAIICNPPFVDVNPIFAAVAKARILPYRFAIEQGVVADETADKIYAQAYAEGVIDRCEDPAYRKFTVDQWAAWLLAHPDHFEELRAVLDHRPNWKLPEERTDVYRHLHA